jgi:hypothetical protein
MGKPSPSTEFQEVVKHRLKVLQEIMTKPMTWPEVKKANDITRNLTAGDLQRAWHYAADYGLLHRMEKVKNAPPTYRYRFEAKNEA